MATYTAVLPNRDRQRVPNLTPQNPDNPPPPSNKEVLGCSSDICPEDPAPNGQKEYAQWKDPFRMSVLDFQRRALDKLAEVLSIYLETKGTLKPKQREDVSALLLRLKQPDMAKEFERKNPNQLALKEMCEALLIARNALAHQKYNKSLQSTEDMCQKDRPKECKTTRTFDHTSKVIDYCIDLTERVVEVISSDKVIFSCP